MSPPLRPQGVFGVRRANGSISEGFGTSGRGKGGAIAVLGLLLAASPASAVPPLGGTSSATSDLFADVAWGVFPSGSEPLADFEATGGMADPTHGPAHGVNPAAVDIASGASSTSNPGAAASAAWALGDDEWLYLRMRLGDSPLQNGNSPARYVSYHWMFLLDPDGDGMSEFVVDVFGGDRAATAATPRYRDGSIAIFQNHGCEDLPTGDPLVDNAITKDQILWAAPASKLDNAYTRTVATGQGKQTWLDVAVPRSELVYERGECAGESALGVGQPFGLFASTSASNTNPLQKDWMAGAVLAPSLALELEADRLAIAEAGTVTYTITLRNDGSGTAPAPTIVDPLPAFTSFVWADAGGAFDPVAGAIEWSLPPLAPGATHTVHVQVQADATIPLLVETIDNVAFSGDAASNVVTLPIARFPAPTLELTPTPATVDAGQKFAVVAAFANPGDATARNATIDLALAGPARFLATAGCELLSDTHLRCAQGALDIGASGTIAALVQTSSPLAAGTHAVDVSGALTYDGGLARAVPANVAVVAAPRLTLADTASAASLGAGETVRYEIVYANTGTVPAENVVVTWTPPPGVEIVGVAPGGTVGDDGRVRWEIGDLPPGEGGSVFVDVRLSPDPPTGETSVSDSVVIEATQAPPTSATTTIVLVAVPDLVVGAQASPSAVGPGGSILLTLTYANAGAAAARDVALSLAIDGPASAQGPTSWSLATLPAGASGSVTVTALADATLPVGTHIVTASPSATATNAPSAHGAPASVSVVAGAQLALVASVEPASARPGDLVTWTLAWTNLGNGTLGDVVLADAPASSIVVEDVSAGGEVASDGTIRWAIGALAAGGTGTASWTGRVAPVMPHGATPVANAARLDAPSVDPVEAAASAVVTAAPSFLLKIEADRAATGPGGTIAYTLRYQNVGDAHADAATLVAALAGPASPGAATWEIGEVLAGQGGAVTLTATASPTLAHGDHLVRATATLASPGTPDAIAAPIDVTIVARALLSLSSSVDPPTAAPGFTARWTLAYANVGNASVDGALLTDAAPEGFLDVVAEDGGAVVAGIATWTLGALAPGGTGTAALRARVPFPMPAGTTLHADDARLQASGPEPASASAPLAVVASPALDIDLAVDRTHALAGELLTYTIRVANVGDADASGVILEDPLPPLVTFSSASDGGGHDASDGTARWAIGALPAGASTQVTLVVRVAPTLPDVDAPVVNVASGSCSEGATAVSNAVTTLVRGVVDVGIVKTASVAEAEEDEIVTYTITVTNTGSAHALDVAISDALPVSHILESLAPAEATWDGATAKLLVPVLAAHGGEATLTIVARVGLVGVRWLPTCNVGVVSGAKFPTESSTACVALKCALPIGVTSRSDASALPLPGFAIGASSHQVGTGSSEDRLGATPLEVALGTVQVHDAQALTSVAPDASAASSAFELGEIDLLGGRIRAKGAFAAVSATAGPDAGSWEATEHRFVDLVIDGVRYDDVRPNTIVPLGGRGSYVALNEVVARATSPTQGRDGIPSRTVEVELTLIRIVLADPLLDAPSADMRIGTADVKAVHAVAPDCGPSPQHARVLAEAIGVSTWLDQDVSRSRVEGPSGGVVEHGVAAFADGLVSVDALRTAASAEVTWTEASAIARVETGAVSILGGLVTAEALRATVSRNGEGEAVIEDVRFVDLRIAGQPYPADVAPNTRIGHGAATFLVLNERATEIDGTMRLTLIRVLGDPDAPGLAIGQLRVNT